MNKIITRIMIGVPVLAFIGLYIYALSLNFKEIMGVTIGVILTFTFIAGIFRLIYE